MSNKYEQWIRDFTNALVCPGGMTRAQADHMCEREIKAMKGPYLKDFVPPTESGSLPWS